MTVPDISNTARRFLACFFGLDCRQTITSHAPHATLASWNNVHRELEAAGLIKIEPYNRHGSISIAATDDGKTVARDARAALILEGRL